MLPRQSGRRDGQGSRSKVTLSPCSPWRQVSGRYLPGEGLAGAEVQLQSRYGLAGIAQVCQGREGRRVDAAVLGDLLLGYGVDVLSVTGGHMVPLSVVR
jgi:hypothetical protein